MSKFCGKCGTPLPDGMRFCTNCGAPVEAPFFPAAEKADEIPPTMALESALADDAPFFSGAEKADEISGTVPLDPDSDANVTVPLDPAVPVDAFRAPTPVNAPVPVDAARYPNGVPGQYPGGAPFPYTGRRKKDLTQNPVFILASAFVVVLVVVVCVLLLTKDSDSSKKKDDPTDSIAVMTGENKDSAETVAKRAMDAYLDQNTDALIDMTADLVFEGAGMKESDLESVYRTAFRSFNTNYKAVDYTLGRKKKLSDDAVKALFPNMKASAYDNYSGKVMQMAAQITANGTYGGEKTLDYTVYLIQESEQWKLLIIKAGGFSS